MQRIIYLLWLFLIFLCSLGAWAQSVEQLYQDGMHKEEILGDLQAAISSYQKAVEQHVKNRVTAAQSQFRIGRCYEKLSKADEALEAYHGVIREFGDQTEVVAQAKERLAALGNPVTPSMVVRQVWVPAESVTGMPSPDGRYLTYVHYPMANLAARDLTTGKTRLLTHDGKWDGPDSEHPLHSIWSPDGMQVAYSWINKGVWELRIVGFDKSEPRMLHRSKGGYVRPHEWSRDGQHVLARLFRKDGTSEVGFVSVADGSVRVLKSCTTPWIGSAKMSISPDGQYIVYDTRPEKWDNQKDIFLLTADGSREIPLIQHSATDYAPVWTPDGNQIVFVSDRLGDLSLWALEVVDGKPHGEPQLIEQNMNHIMPLGFTNDGTYYYAFATAVGVEISGDVCIVTLDPATGKALAAPEKIPQREGTNFSPDWSPDGKYLAYMSVRGLSAVSSYVIVIRSVETGEERELPVNYDRMLHWSPDGRTILIRHYKGPLALLNVETGDVNPVGDYQPGSRIYNPGWYQDSKHILYRRAYTGTYRWSVMVRNLETGEEKELLHGDEKYGPGDFVLSPDGEHLAFITRHSLQVMPSTGSEAREVYRLSPSEKFPIMVGPEWTPDGRYIIAGKGKRYPDDPAAETHQLYDVYRFSVEGGDPEKLGFTMKAFHELSVHPDGRQIAFTQPGARRQKEIWAMENFLPE